MGLGPAHLSIGDHAPTQVLLEIGIGVFREDIQERIHGCCQYVTREVSVLIPVEATARRVRCMAINAREFQGPGIHQRRNAVGPGQVERLVLGEWINVMAGQESLFISPLALDPAPAQDPFTRGCGRSKCFDLSECGRKRIDPEKIQRSRTTPDAFQVLVAIREPWVDNMTGQVQSSLGATLPRFGGALVADEYDAIAPNSQGLGCPAPLVDSIDSGVVD